MGVWVDPQALIYLFIYQLKEIELILNLPTKKLMKALIVNQANNKSPQTMFREALIVYLNSDYFKSLEQKAKSCPE